METIGLSLELFEAIDSKNIDIVNIDYSYSTSISLNIDINSIIKCISCIFNVTEDKLGKGIQMRCKRVSNYDEMTAQDAFIIELFNKGVVMQHIEKAMIDSFGIDPNRAREIILAKIADFQMERNGGKKQLKIKNNPGISVNINQEKFSNNIQSLESMIVKEEDLVELFQNYTLNVNITDNVKPSKK